MKISYQGTDSPAGLKHEVKMVNQCQKGLFALGGQAQIVFNLDPSMLGGVIFHQLDSFPLGQVMVQNMYPGVLEP